MDSARACFVESGYVPTRMEDIARRASLSKGGVYFYFSSKRMLFEALVEQEYTRQVGFLQEELKQSGSVRTKLAQLGRYYTEYYVDHVDSARFFVVMGEVALREPALRQRLLAIHTAFLDGVTKVLDQGIETGEVKMVDSKMVALMLKSLMDGIEGSLAMGFKPDINAFLSTALAVVVDGLLQPEWKSMH